MGLVHINCCLGLAIAWLSVVASLSDGSAATSDSDGVFGSSASTVRRLLQLKKQCPVNFESQNYTIITERCKGPTYPPSLCCPALKEFACPFVDILNDLTNDCATVMFSYINLQGHYPPGLFANECKEGRSGLACPSTSTPGARTTKSAGYKRGSLPLMVLVVVSVFSMQFIMS